MLTVSDGLSDHHIVIVDVNFSRTLVQSKRNVSYRPIHKIDIDALMTDILKSDLIRDPEGHLSDLCKQYYHVLKALLNKHAPITTKSVSEKPPAPWMTPELLQSKRHHRYLERVYGANHAHLWIDHVIQNIATTATLLSTCFFYTCYS